MSVEITLTEDSYLVHYADEFDLRDGLARTAQMAGWDVDTEHVVPGWGRPDLYLTSGTTHLAVEMKVNLETVSRCRKGIQQADGYRNAMPEVSAVYLCAPSINRDLMAPYAAAYLRVQVVTFQEMTRVIQGDALTLRARHLLALDRFREAELSLEIHRRELSALSNFLDSPIGVHVREPNDNPGASELSMSDVMDMFFGSTTEQALAMWQKANPGKDLP